MLAHLSIPRDKRSVLSSWNESQASQWAEKMDFFP